MLLPAFSTFKDQHPDIHLSLEVKPAPVILEKVKHFEIDLGIISFDRFTDPELHQEPLIRDDLRLLLHPAHRLANQDEITIEDLHLEPFILHEQGSVSRRLIDDWISKQQISLTEVMEVSSTETMKKAVKHRIGMAIVSERCAAEEVAQGKLISRPIPGFQVDRFIYAVYHRHKMLTPNMVNFLDLLKQRCLT